jgi:glycosyltransferase involved in cell wall biosynthesis
MLGWEFPPFVSGGLGTACFGLTKALSDLGTEVLFVLPRGPAAEKAGPVSVLALEEGAEGRGRTYWTVEGLKNVRLMPIASGLSPYLSPQEYAARASREEAIEARPGSAAVAAGGGPAAPVSHASRPTSLGLLSPDRYTGDLIGEVHRYARLAAELARHSQFDVIHAHDWMTFPAALSIAALTGRPLVVHVHSTEFDRSGSNVNPRVYDIERAGVHGADRVICVSHLTQGICTSRYGVPQAKCRVIYNAITVNGAPIPDEVRRIEKDDRIVLFLGRITMQKGPEYFLAAAKKVLEVMDNVKFIMAGSGDMIKRMIELAAALGIGHRVTFTGFLRGGDVDRVFRMADLYVMPSVSEPFGLAPLEALSHDVPVIISKQSGVSEVLTHALKVDFWDIHEMANKIVAVLRHPPLHKTLRQHGAFEVRKFSWTDSARACLEVYQEAMGR